MKIISLVIGVLLPISFGFLLKNIRIFKLQDSKVLRKFVIKATVPFIIFRNLYNAEYEELNQIFPLVSAFIILTILFFLISLLFFKSTKFDIAKKNSFSFATMFGNYGYLGWGICFQFFGNAGLTRSVFFTMFFWPVFLIFGFLFIIINSYKTISIHDVLKILGKNALPPIFSALLGITFNIFDFVVPDVIWNFIINFAGITIPLILFTIGIELNFRLNLHDIKIVLYSTFSRLILGFFLGFITLQVILFFFNPDLISQKVILIESIMPTATMVPFFSEFSITDEEITSGIITFSTILSLITIPLFYLLIESVIFM